MSEEKLKESYFIREKSADAFVKNIKAMEALGWTEFIEKLKTVPERVIPVQKDIVFSNVVNPLFNIFIGFSSRTLIESMKRKKKIVRMTLVIEPDMGVFKHLIATEDISDLLLNENIDWVIGTEGEELIPILYRRFTMPIDKKSGVSRSTLIQNIEMIIDPWSNNTPELEARGKEIMSLVMQSIQQVKLSMGCPDDQFTRFELLMRNKENMYKAWKITDLFKKFEDIPAIVLGGGPSLDEFISAYKENPSLKNSIIIAADAVLRKLLENGIKPHIVTRCERKLTNIFEGISKDMTKGIYYAAYPWTPPEYFELFDDYFYLFRQNGVCLFTKLSHGFVDGGVSAGNAALEIAFSLGCKNIFLSGIDACMSEDGKTHTAGTEVEFNIEKSKAKWSTVKTNSGREATTIPVWDRCRKEYTQAIAKWAEKGAFNVVNTATDGAVIPLSTFKPWKEAGEYFSSQPVDISAMINKYKSKISQKEKDAFDALVKEAVVELKKYLSRVDVALGLMEDAKRTAMREIEKLVDGCQSSARDPYEMILLLNNNKMNLDKLWSNVADAIDSNFKTKLYSCLTFRILIFDVLQLQLFNYENATGGLVNKIEDTHQRYFIYYNITKEFMGQVRHYLKAFLELFEKE